LSTGNLPLTSDKNYIAWNLYNPYRHLDILNTSLTIPIAIYPKIGEASEKLQTLNPTIDRNSILSVIRP